MVQRQGHVFGQGHGTPEGVALVEHPGMAHQGGPLFVIQGPQIGGAIQYPAGGGPLQADEMPEQGGLATAGAADDEKDVTQVDREVDVTLEHDLAVGHGQVLHGQYRSGSTLHTAPTLKILKRMVSTASATTIRTMPITTAAVVDSPTAEALRPQRMPW